MWLRYEVLAAEWLPFLAEIPGSPTVDSHLHVQSAINPSGGRTASNDNGVGSVKSHGLGDGVETDSKARICD
jgi:hypothetical protein